MKRLTLFLFAILFLGQLSAQTPEPIVSYAVKSMPMDYYRQQVEAWKKVINKNSKDAAAWYYCYYAMRILNYNDKDNTRTPEEREAAIQKHISEMEKAVPNSFEFNLCKWMAGGFDMELLPYLEKAAVLGKDRTEHLSFMVNIGETTRNLEKRNQHILKQYQAGQISTGLIYYNYNVLAGLETNAILVTAGDNDTYPVWALQAQGIRTDVKVVNLNLIWLDDYRAKLFAELGIREWSSAEMQQAQQDKKYQEALLNKLASNSKNYPLYLALTASGSPGKGCSNTLGVAEENLYLTGLAYLYSPESIDNIALLRKNFEREYALDYLTRAFYPEIAPGPVGYLNTNYLVPMLKLYEHYKTSGETHRAGWMKNLLLAVSKDTESENEVRQALEN